MCILPFQNKWLWKTESNQGKKHRAMSADSDGKKCPDTMQASYPVFVEASTL